MKIFVLLFLVLLPLPIPLFGIPSSNLFFLFMLGIVVVSSLAKGRFSYYFVSIVFFLFILLFLSIRSSAFSGLDHLLGLARYFTAIVPVFLLLPLTKYMLKLTPKGLRILLFVSMMSFVIMSSFSFISSCRTVYGGPCVLLSKSSSFGSIASLFLASFSLMLLSIRDKLTRIFSILFATFFLVFGVLQGSRMFWLLFAFALLVFFAYRINLRRFIVNLSLDKFSFTSLILLIPFFVLLANSPLIRNATSLARTLSFIINPLDDGRITQGIIAGSRYNLEFSDVLFGKSLFSQLSAWNSTSSYDSTINLLFSDFGIVGTIIIFLLIFISINEYFRFISSHNLVVAPICFALLLYLVGSIANEFLLLKAFNPLVVYILSLYTVALSPGRAFSTKSVSNDADIH